MTTEEREAFRQSVAAELAQASVECGHNIMHQFNPQELSEACERPGFDLLNLLLANEQICSLRLAFVVDC